MRPLRFFISLRFIRNDTKLDFFSSLEPSRGGLVDKLSFIAYYL